MRCDYCAAPLVEPLLWHGRVFMTEDKDGIPTRHLCSIPELPPPNERWFRMGVKGLDRRVKPAQAPVQDAGFKSPPPPPKRKAIYDGGYRI